MDLQLRNYLLNLLHQNILEYETGYSQLFDNLLRHLKERNYKQDKETVQLVRQMLEANEKFIKSFLNTSITIVAEKQSKWQPDKAIKILQDKIFNQEYPDGLTLSERLWKNRAEAEKEFFQVLKKQLQLGKSAIDTAYKIQHHMEKIHQQEFTKLTNEKIKLIDKLKTYTKAMIKGEISKEKFNQIINQYRKYIDKRTVSPYGVKNSHQQLLKNLTKAVETASMQAVDEAIKWYMYDKQLYNLRRIARTETANTFHIMTIETTKDNPLLVGYRWKLSPAHNITDICDTYANINYGLGKGVFPPDKVPTRIAHPHCTCIIEPVFKTLSNQNKP